MRRYKEKLLAVLMAILTVIFCLVIADGILGTDGHADGSTWYVKDDSGRIFFWVSMVTITSVFAFLVEWKHTWIVIPVYILLYIPVSAYFGESPQHTYLDKSAMAAISLFPELEFLNPLTTALWFWVIQSATYFLWYLVRKLFGMRKKA